MHRVFGLSRNQATEKSLNDFNNWEAEAFLYISEFWC